MLVLGNALTCSGIGKMNKIYSKNLVAINKTIIFAFVKM